MVYCILPEGVADLFAARITYVGERIMKEAVMAIYEDGILRLLTPLSLPESTRVLVHVEPVDQALASPDDYRTQTAKVEADPLSDLIGAYHSSRSLIDGIPVSEDPDLYLVAEMLGEEAVDLHAWEIAPARYMQSQDGHPIRRSTVEEAR